MDLHMIMTNLGLPYDDLGIDENAVRKEQLMWNSGLISRGDMMKSKKDLYGVQRDTIATPAALQGKTPQQIQQGAYEAVYFQKYGKLPQVLIDDNGMGMGYAGPGTGERATPSRIMQIFQYDPGSGMLTVPKGYGDAINSYFGGTVASTAAAPQQQQSSDTTGIAETPGATQVDAQTLLQRDRNRRQTTGG